MSGIIKKRFFFIESDWFENEKEKHSILPLLECLKGVYSNFSYIYRTANTKEELQYCLSKFKTMAKSSKLEDLNILVLCGHGAKGKIFFGVGEHNETPLTLEELKELFIDLNSKGKKDIFSNTLIHFDSCFVLGANENKLNDFWESVGFVGISGFTKKAYFIQSYALELLYFEKILNLNSLKLPLRNFEKKHSDGLGKDTGFRILI